MNLEGWIGESICTSKDIKAAALLTDTLIENHMIRCSGARAKKGATPKICREKKPSSLVLMTIKHCQFYGSVSKYNCFICEA